MKANTKSNNLIFNHNLQQSLIGYFTLLTNVASCSNVPNGLLNSISERLCCADANDEEDDDGHRELDRVSH